MNTEPPSAQSETRNVNLWKVVAITLACVFVFQSVASLIRGSGYEGRAKRSETLLAGQEQRAQRSEAYYQRIEDDEKRTHALIDRQEQANARFQQVLINWERQQKEYQAYLDSLKQPH